MIKRYALVRGHNIDSEVVARYLPANYHVQGDVIATEPWGKEYKAVVIGGIDSFGWTMKEYVIPRLSSGLMSATEIDLSHPVMKQIPTR